MAKILFSAKEINGIADWIVGQVNEEDFEGKEVEIDLLSGNVSLYDRDEGGMGLSKRPMSYFT